MTDAGYKPEPKPGGRAKTETPDAVIARAADMDTGNFSRWKNGQRDTGNVVKALTVLGKISRALGVEYEWLAIERGPKRRQAHGTSVSAYLRVHPALDQSAPEVVALAAIFDRYNNPTVPPELVAEWLDDLRRAHDAVRVDDKVRKAAEAAKMQAGETDAEVADGASFKPEPESSKRVVIPKGDHPSGRHPKK